MDTARCANTRCTRYPRETCTGCYGAHYCSSGCQQSDWPLHKHECLRTNASTTRDAALLAERLAPVGAGGEEVVEEMFGDEAERRMFDADDDADDATWAHARAAPAHGATTLVYEIVHDGDASSTHASSTGAPDVAVFRWLDSSDSMLCGGGGENSPQERARAATTGSVASSTTSAGDVSADAPLAAAQHASSENARSDGNAPATEQVFYESVGELIYNAYTGCYIDECGTPVFNIDTHSTNLGTEPMHGTRLRLVTRLGAPPPHVMLGAPRSDRHIDHG